MPAAGQRACRGHRDGDALDRRFGGIGVDGIGLPGLPGPRRRGQSGEPGGRPQRASGSGCSRSAPRARAGRPVHRRAPGLARSGPREDGALRRADRRHEPGARRLASAGRIGADTVAAIVVPVWMRTLEEIRAPFEAGGGRVDGLELESAELFRLDNPYWDDDPAVFARDYVRSVLAWGEPLMRTRVRASRVRTAPPVSSPTSSARSRTASPTPPTAIAGTTSRPSSSAERRTPPSATRHRPRRARLSDDQLCADCQPTLRCWRSSLHFTHDGQSVTSAADDERLSRRGFIAAGAALAGAAALPASASAGAARPRGFPRGVDVARRRFVNWAQAIEVDGVWTCAPRTPAGGRGRRQLGVAARLPRPGARPRRTPGRRSRSRARRRARRACCSSTRRGT